MFAVTTTVEAIYERGKILLPEPLSLPEKSPVRVTIESDVAAEIHEGITRDFARVAEPSFQKIWDNPLDADYDKL